MHVNDIQVTGYHQGFGRDGSDGGVLIAAEAQLHAPGSRNQHHIFFANRSWPPPVQTFFSKFISG
jgi:hypothetical protein